MKNYFFIPHLFMLLCPLLIFSGEKSTFTLDEILKIGLEHNPWLSARKSEALAKQEAYNASKRLFNPELELHAGRGKFYEGTETQTTQGIAVTQPVENPFKRYYRIQPR